MPTDPHDIPFDYAEGKPRPQMTDFYGDDAPEPNKNFHGYEWLKKQGIGLGGWGRLAIPVAESLEGWGG